MPSSALSNPNCDTSFAASCGDKAGVSWPAAMLVAAVRAYQVLLAPIVGGACRYHPTCSHYMVEAVTRYGAVRGGWLGLRRIGRCHPFGGHGLDPVPDLHVTPPESASAVRPGNSGKSDSQDR